MRHNIVARIIFDQASTEQNTSFNTHCTALDTSTHYQIHINYTVTVDPNAYKWKNKPQNIQSSCITTYAWCFLSWQSVIIMQIFSSCSTCFNILYLLTIMIIMIVIFEICDETQNDHKNVMIRTKTIGIGTAIMYNYHYYGSSISTCFIFIFSICTIYFNFAFKSLCDTVNLKHQTEMKRVKMKLIGGNESYNIDDNVTVMAQVYVHKNCDFNDDFNLHFLRNYCYY